MGNDRPGPMGPLGPTVRDLCVVKQAHGPRTRREEGPAERGGERRMGPKGAAGEEGSSRVPQDRRAFQGPHRPDRPGEAGSWPTARPPAGEAGAVGARATGPGRPAPPVQVRSSGIGSRRNRCGRHRCTVQRAAQQSARGGTAQAAVTAQKGSGNTPLFLCAGIRLYARLMLY